MDNNLVQAIAEANGYLHVCEKGDAGICALMPLMYTFAIISECNMYGYGNRWCYHNYADAKAAFDAWDGKDGTEPTGWHRHPATGRRVDEKTGEIYVCY